MSLTAQLTELHPSLNYRQRNGEKSSTSTTTLDLFNQPFLCLAALDVIDMRLLCIDGKHASLSSTLSELAISCCGIPIWCGLGLHFHTQVQRPGCPTCTFACTIQDYPYGM